MQNTEEFKSQQEDRTMTHGCGDPPARRQERGRASHALKDGSKVPWSRTLTCAGGVRSELQAADSASKV